MIGTPSNLEFLLHCYYSSDAHPRLNAPAIQEGARYLLDEGMIVLSGMPKIYSCTPKGIAYIKYILEVPFPVEIWVMP